MCEKFSGRGEQVSQAERKTSKPRENSPCQSLRKVVASGLRVEVRLAKMEKQFAQEQGLPRCTTSNTTRIDPVGGGGLTGRSGSARIGRIALLAGLPHWVQASRTPDCAASGKGKELEEKRKPPLEIGPLKAWFASELGDPGGEEGPRFPIKPGHWTATVQSMKANYKDFVGQFSAEMVDDTRQPVALAHTHFGLRVTRSVTLARESIATSVESLFVPLQYRRTPLDARLVDRDSGTEVFEFRPKLEFIPAYQYNIVVLAKEPAQYAFLKTTNTIRAPWEEEFDESSQVHYQVTLAKAGIGDSAARESRSLGRAWPTCFGTKLIRRDFRRSINSTRCSIGCIGGAGSL